MRRKRFTYVLNKGTHTYTHTKKKKQTNKQTSKKKTNEACVHKVHQRTNQYLEITDSFKNFLKQERFFGLRSSGT